MERTKGEWHLSRSSVDGAFIKKFQIQFLSCHFYIQVAIDSAGWISWHRMEQDCEWNYYLSDLS